MSSVEELCETLEGRLTQAGVDTRTVEQSPGSTIVPRSLGAAGQRAMSLLDELAVATLGHKVDLYGTIGEGGMGIVRLATQRALGRDVAVKSIKAEHKNDRSVLKLLREAWVTGGLEHPNVVPVYDIALDADGAPLIILKKIDGVDWGTLMHDARAVRDRFGADDLLDWNLRTFMQVCNAIRFAHDRKVLHRDLKPENVMIGGFGEVYLVDWGIALSLTDDGSGRVPLASEAVEMAGTPLYMAPEMLGGSSSRLSERTDIYLLGSTLYEIACGRPPHTGSSFMAIVGSIAASEPVLDPSVPDELARIIRRAMDPDPDARFENAEQVRLAVQAFLQRRDAARLAERAEERLRELSALIEASRDGQASPEEREAIYHLFGECRFGFRHALEAWPGNDAARASLDRAIAAVVEHELALGQPEAARTLLAEMADVPAALDERVEEARRAKHEADADLRRLKEDLDPSRGRPARFSLAVIMGVIWTGIPLASHWVAPALEAAFPWIGIVPSAAFLVVLGGLAWWARESMSRTAINRRLVLAALAAMLAQLLGRLAAFWTGDSMFETFHDTFLVWAGIAVMVASAVDWRLSPAAAGYVAAYLFAPMVGLENVLLVMSAANAILLLSTLVLWARSEEHLRGGRRITTAHGR